MAHTYIIWHIIMGSIVMWSLIGGEGSLGQASELSKHWLTIDSLET